MLFFLSSFQYEHYTTYSKNSTYNGEAPQNHPRDPLLLFGTLMILFWNCRGFPWCKGPEISWILSDIDIICLVETGENEESKVPNIEVFVLWSAWNQNSYHRGIWGIACYIRKNISPHIQLHMIDPLNQHIWIEISDNNAKKMYIEICYFAPIISTFLRKTI